VCVSAVYMREYYVGCYKDDGDRVMSASSIHHRSMTVDRCHHHCKESVNTYFGLEVTHQFYVIPTQHPFTAFSPVKQSRVDSMGWMWGRVPPPKSGGRVWGYNLKLSTLHNDSIPETPSGKKWGGQLDMSTTVHPVNVLTALDSSLLFKCL